MMTLSLSLRAVVVFFAAATDSNVGHAFYHQQSSTAAVGRPSSSISSTQQQQLIPCHVGGGSGRRQFGSNSITTTTTRLEEHTLNQDPYNDNFMEEDGPKSQLLQEIDYNDVNNIVAKFGFSDSNEKKNAINKLVDDLSGYVLPLDKPSEWKLLYNTAPDFLGVQGGPLSQLVSITQNVLDDGDQLEIVLEYKPSETVMSLASNFIDDIEDDRLKQTLTFDYEVGSMNKVDLQIRGTKIEGTRFGGDSNSLPSLTSPTPIPFVGFSIVFNDGDLRVDRTIQGDFLYIYKRI